MTGIIKTLIILSIIAVIFSMVTLFYVTAASRRRVIFMKKADYLIEDLTYKSEMLNPTVETIVKMSNYIDVFEVIARKNMKSAVKVVSRNKDDIYKILDRIKKFAVGPEEKTKGKDGKK